MLRFVLQAEDPTLDALAARVAALEGRLQHRQPRLPRRRHEPRPNPHLRRTRLPHRRRPEATAAPIETNLTLQRLEHHWPAIIERVREKKPSISGHLARARLIDFDGTTLTIAVPDETTLKMLRGEIDLAGQTLAERDEAKYVRSRRWSRRAQKNATSQTTMQPICSDMRSES